MVTIILNIYYNNNYVYADDCIYNQMEFYWSMAQSKKSFFIL